MKIITERLQNAIKFATEKHFGQKRMGGDDYISHPIAVATMLQEEGRSENCCIAGLFHDLLEDTSATEEEILKLGGEEVLTAVKLLTKKPGYKMAEYVKNVKDNEIAFAVKGADRLHNLICAIVADDAFKRKYVIESLEWYLDFSPKIFDAVKQLARSIDGDKEDLKKLYPQLF